MNAKELQSKSMTELHQELQALLHERFNLRMQRGMGQATKPHLFKRVRRDIARVKTILKQKEASE